MAQAFLGLVEFTVTGRCAVYCNDGFSMIEQFVFAVTGQI
ncbi:hypothetical protein AWB74_06270 [Caballeronia arvi]|uniref:Uncharacterized protein n=2 Tax=Caballeronia arvi TaxID=1777135 RepID=A0A158KMR8_9BURK|nr:hypothetical protein AWB74_06270 [Caballeronia arvi]